MRVSSVGPPLSASGVNMRILIDEYFPALVGSPSEVACGYRAILERALSARPELHVRTAAIRLYWSR